VALGIAAAADAIQFAFLPLFGEGFASPLDDALDVAVAGLLVWLLGFHWALVPAAASELVPGLDLAPTWTASVLLIISTGKTRRWIVAATVAALALTLYAVIHFIRAGSG
jgi:hypothetical protein